MGFANPSQSRSDEDMITRFRAAERPSALRSLRPEAGRLVATLDMVTVAVLTDGAAPTAVVMNMVVDRLYRRAGIGRALLEAAVSLARNARCGMVELLSSKERAETHRFYRSLGFEAHAEGFRLSL
jgi:GNAT superfamily N-acetyltransferase